MTGDLSIVENLKLREILSKGPKYREPASFSWKYNSKIIMDAVEDYARRWVKQEDIELDSLSEWIKSIRHLLKRRMYMACRSVFNDIDVSNNLTDLHKHYVIVPADKASNNVVFVCKAYYFNCLKKELDLDVSVTNSTYQRTNVSKDEILANHRSVLYSFNIDTVGKDTDLPLLYWIPKLHKVP